MNDFDRFYKENKLKLSVASREDLAKICWQAAIESTQEKPILTFNGEDINDYELAQILVVESPEAFNFSNEGLEGLTQKELQEKLNTTCSVDLVEWVLASEQKPCVLELSSGNVVDWSTLSGQEGKTETERSFLAIVTADTNYVSILEIKKA